MYLYYVINFPYDKVVLHVKEASDILRKEILSNPEIFDDKLADDLDDLYKDLGTFFNKSVEDESNDYRWIFIYDFNKKLAYKIEKKLEQIIESIDDKDKDYEMIKKKLKSVQSEFDDLYVYPE